MYFQWKLFSLEFGKPQNLHLTARWFGKVEVLSASKSSLWMTKNPHKFHVPSRRRNWLQLYDWLHSRDLYLSPGYERQGMSPPSSCGTEVIWNFILQTAKDRFNLATLAVRNNENLNVAQFVSLHQKAIESNPHYFGDEEMEDDIETLPSTTDSAGSPEMYRHVDSINSVTNDAEHLADQDVLNNGTNNTTT